MVMEIRMKSSLMTAEEEDRAIDSSIIFMHKWRDNLRKEFEDKKMTTERAWHFWCMLSKMYKADRNNKEMDRDLVQRTFLSDELGESTRRKYISDALRKEMISERKDKDMRTLLTIRDRAKKLVAEQLDTYKDMVILENN